MPQPLAPRRSRRLPVLAAAAAVALIGVGAYAFNSIGSDPTQQASGNGSGTQVVSAEALSVELTSTDCSDVKVVSGTLQEKDGSSVVLETSSGKSVTVTTSDSTEITQQVSGSVDDIVEGSTVFVSGKGSENGKSVTAERIGLLPESAELPGLLDGSRELGGRLDLDMGRMMAERGHASGKVTNVDSSGFTVARSDGTEIEIATSESTKVIEQAEVDVSELKEGEFTVAVGSPNDDGTLAANSLQQNTLSTGDLPSLPDFGFRDRSDGERPRMPFDGSFREQNPEGLPGIRPDGNLRERLPDDLFSGLGCNASTLATTAVMAVNT